MQLVSIIAHMVPLQRWLPTLELGPRLEFDQSPQGLWIEPGDVLELINAWQVASWALAVATVINPAIAFEPGKRGAPLLYPNEVVLLTTIVMRLWRKGYESFTSWLARNPKLARQLGYTRRDEEGHLRTISSSQLSRRTRRLGLLPFFLFFVVMVVQLVRVGLIKGKDLIIDCSKLQAWYHEDGDARWSYPSLGGSRTFGYKIHTVLCRYFTLPVMFWVTAANRNECLLAIPMLAGCVLFYGFRVMVVRADAAYFTYPILHFIVNVLGAYPIIDYNLRRLGKKFLATLGFIAEWRRLMGPRSDIERHYAWAKRYFGLKYFQLAGLNNVLIYCCCTYIGLLAVALVAYRCGRSELAGSRTQVLAWT